MSYMFGIRLKFLRKANKLSQSQLADRIMVSRTTYASWEANKAEPDLDTIHRICEFYDVSADFLLHIEEKRANPTLDQLRAELWELITEADEDSIKAILNIIKRMR